MPTYDIIGGIDGASSSEVAAAAVFGSVVICDFYGVSGSSVLVRSTDSSVRGRLEGIASSEAAGLTWTRGIGGALAGQSSASASVYTNVITVSVSAESVATMNANVAFAHNGLLLSDVARAVYALWGYDGITDLRTINVGRERIVEWCNAAMQLIYSRAEKLEYFNTESLTATVPSAGYVALPSTVQRIQGEARIAGRSLRTLASKAQVDDFAAYYPGATTPLAFYVDTTRDTGADSIAMVLYLAPVPSGDTEVVLDVTNEPPRWNSSDLLQGSVIPLPHRWVETIFMPLVRKWACADSAMPAPSRQAQSKEIDEQYAAARSMLGLADVEPAAVKDGKGGRADS